MGMRFVYVTDVYVKENWNVTIFEILRTNIKRFKLANNQHVACVTIVVLRVAIDTLKVALRQDSIMLNTNSSLGCYGWRENIRQELRR